jgi:hypothetical protein
MIFSGWSAAASRLIACGRVFDTGGNPVGWILVLIGNMKFLDLILSQFIAAWLDD